MRERRTYPPNNKRDAEPHLRPENLVDVQCCDDAEECGEGDGEGHRRNVVPQ